MKRIQIKDNIDLQRDLSSKAVINNNRSAYEARSKQKEINASKDREIENIKSDISEIKSMLKQIIGGM